MPASCVFSLDLTPRWRETASVSRDAMERMPRPPTWMASRMTMSPNTDQCSAVFTAVRPVTENAETAVNIASCSGVT